MVSVWKEKPPAQPHRGRTRGFNHSTNDNQSLAATVVIIVVRIRVGVTVAVTVGVGICVGVAVGVRVRVGIGITVTIAIGVSACPARIPTSIKSLLAGCLVRVGSLSALLILLSTTLLALPSRILADCDGREQIGDGHEHVCRQDEEQKIIDLDSHELVPP